MSRANGQGRQGAAGGNGSSARAGGESARREDDGSARGDDRRATVRRTRRWRGIVAVALAALAIGVLAKRPSLLLVSGVGVAFAAYPRVTDAPEPRLAVERRVTPESPDAGERVAVTTTLRNEGQSALFDCRVVDGVPPMLEVTGGSPRAATALRPGEEVAVTYDVEARQGRHRFRPTTVVARDASGTREVETTAVESTTLECSAGVPAVPLRGQSRHRSGHLVTDDGGSGTEFHRVREYEHGDSTSRVDWRRYARTGELTSLEFRAERLADVVVCVDARPAAYRAAGADEPHAVAYAVEAAERLLDALFDDGQRVGLAAFGRARCWLPPGSNRSHRDRLRRRLATDPAFDLQPPAPEVSTRASGRVDGGVADGGAEAGDADGDGGDREPLERQLATIRAHLTPRTQVLLLTPLCDDASTRVVQSLEAGGAAVTVVSPDVTAGETVGGKLAALEREARLSALRNAGVPTVDWDPDRRLGAALAAAERWSR